MKGCVLELNVAGIEDFLNFGILKPGTSFFQISYPKFSQSSPSWLHCRVNSKISFEEAADQIYQAFSESLSVIVRSGHCQSFAMSGGADSRLIFDTLNRNHPNELRKLRIYSRIHPQLGLEFDQDYLSSQALCHQYGLELNPEVAQKNATTYLLPLGDSIGKSLSGLWGGEVLGGQILKMKTFSMTDLKMGGSSSPLANFVHEQVGSIEAEDDQLEFLIHFLLLRESFCTAFYESVNWFFPRGGDRYALTPFLHPVFLQAIFSIPVDYIKDYRLYQLILEKYCSESLKPPINNPMLKESDILKTGGKGVDPKSQSPYIEEAQELSLDLAKVQNYAATNKQKKFSHALLRLLPHLDWVNWEEEFLFEDPYSRF